MSWELVPETIAIGSCTVHTRKAPRWEDVTFYPGFILESDPRSQKALLITRHGHYCIRLTWNQRATRTTRKVTYYVWTMQPSYQPGGDATRQCESLAEALSNVPDVLMEVTL